MRYVSFRNRFLFPALTLLLGLCLGGIFPHTPIHAVATDRTESFLYLKLTKQTYNWGAR